MRIFMAADDFCEGYHAFGLMAGCTGEPQWETGWRMGPDGIWSVGPKLFMGCSPKTCFGNCDKSFSGFAMDGEVFRTARCFNDVALSCLFHSW